jgi:ketosteroid isomerase-like protein
MCDPLTSLREFVSAMGTGDEQKALALTSPDVEFLIMTVPEGRVLTADGRDLFRGVQRQISGHVQLAKLVSSVSMTYQSLTVQNFRGVADGSSLAAEFGAVGETALGNPYVNSYCAFADLDESGLITRYREYLDPGPLAGVIADLMTAMSRRRGG